MSIKTRIWLFQAIVAFSVIVMAITSVFATRTAKDYFDRLLHARKELAMTSDLAIDANRYAEQIAELILIGPAERSDFESARADVYKSFFDVKQLDLRITAESERDDIMTLSLYERMHLLIDSIDGSVDELLALSLAGKRDEAIAQFRYQIENRLDSELEYLIAENVRSKQAEVDALESVTEQLRQKVTVSVLGLLAVLLALISVSGYLLARSIGRPIRALAAGTRAIEQGSLHYRIGSQARDELGVLSRSFDAMAEQLHGQHAQLLASKSQLECEVAQRTQDLAQANHRLTQVDQQRVRLLADISHELRTPLTALRGEAEIALRGKAWHETMYREALAAVVARAQEMGHLIEDLLFLARSEGDDIVFEKAPLDLKEVALAAIQDTNVLARRQDVRLVMQDAPTDAVPIWGDRARLKQAAMIALDNAIKYSPAATTVEVSVRASAQGELIVRDHGVGCAEQDLPHVFDRFYRGTLARERWAAGSGLGLSIARWIVQKHQGTVDFSSTAGKGSTFTVRLPLRHRHV
ncbi:histidine kinase [Bordetella tumbae]|uniref:sensor histidine kinase n=1 Tax=Bordetella tumbae TaxID=1649139 RepID=UPI0039F1069B